MGSPSSVLTLGLGSWGSVNDVIRLGYASGAAAQIYPAGKWHRLQWTLARIWRYVAMPVNTLEAVTLTKTESDDRDYLFDLQTAPEIVAGATCSSGTITGGSGLTFGTPAVLASEIDGIAIGKGMSVRISGGSDDTTYSFALKVTLSSGRIVVIPCRLVVVSDDGS